MAKLESTMRTIDKLRLWQWGIHCFLLGHDIWYSDRNDPEPDQCSHCFLEYPQDDTRTIPSYLGRLYTWMVERDWIWFNRLDQWLLSNHANRLPGWWKY